MQYKAELYHMLSGLSIVILNIYLALNLDHIESVLTLFFEEETMPMAKGLSAFIIIQFFRGVLITHGTQYWGGFTTLDVKRYNEGYRYGSNKSQPQQASTDKSTFSEPSRELNDFMNSKMAGMTNAQKISYMSKYYGGKL